MDPGCAAEPWYGNVVALGDAAAHFEPLAWINLDLAHRQLSLLLDQHARHGRTPFFEETPLLVQELSALLDAVGHPRGEGALALAVDPLEVEAAQRAFAGKAAAAVRAIPPYGAWLREVLRA